MGKNKDKDSNQKQELVSSRF